MINFLNYINPFSKKNHAYDSFKTLKGLPKLAVLTLSVLGSIIPILGTTAAFRWSVSLFNNDQFHKKTDEKVKNTAQVIKPSSPPEPKPQPAKQQQPINPFDRISEIIERPIETMEVETFIELKNLNRQLKRQIQSDPDQKLLDLQTQYKEFLKKSIVLQLFKGAVKLLKEDNENKLHNQRGEEPVYRTIDILFKFAKEVEADPSKRREKILHDKELRQKMKVRIWKAYRDSLPLLQSQKAEDPLRLNAQHDIKWVHGTKSSALAMMLHLARIGKVAKPALIPTGELIKKHKAPPLSGELMMGIIAIGVNQEHISGVRFKDFTVSARYAAGEDYGINVEAEKEIIDTFNEVIQQKPAKLPPLFQRFHVAILRLLRTGQRPELIQQCKIVLQNTLKHFPPAPPVQDLYRKYANLISMELERIPENAQPLNRLPQPGELLVYKSGTTGKYHIVPVTSVNKNNNFEVFYKGNFSSIASQNKYPLFVLTEDELKKLSIGRPEVDPVELQKVEERLKTPSMELREKKIFEEMLHDIETIKPYEFNTLEQELIKNPAPLVFATLDEKKMVPVQAEIHDSNVLVPGAEKAIKGELALGNDLQIAFTNEKNLERMRRVLAPLGVQVFSFDTGLLLSKLTYQPRIWS